MTDFTDKSCLVIDNGLFVSLAERLVGSFGKVGFFCDWQSAFPDGRELLIGWGLDGITREKYLWPALDEYDLIVFPDVWQGDLQEELRRQGKRVWGAGMQSTLELDRWATHQKLKELGLDIVPAEQVTGIAALREYLQQHDNVFVKVSAYRGLGETWQARNYDQVKGYLDDFEAKHGALAEIVVFIVEPEIKDAKEIGYDGYCIEGEFPNTAFWGVESKDKAYFGKLVDYDALPANVRKTNTALSYLMDGYRQFFSTELREVGKKAYPIDLTCRHASPAGECYVRAFENLAEILWFGAEGRLVHPVCSTPFAAQLILTSEWAESHWFEVEFPQSLRPWLSLYNHCRINGRDYTIPQVYHMQQVGSVVGLGKTKQEAIALCKERAKQIMGFELEYDEDALDKAAKDLEAAQTHP